MAEDDKLSQLDNRHSGSGGGNDGDEAQQELGNTDSSEADPEPEPETEATGSADAAADDAGEKPEPEAEDVPEADPVTRPGTNTELQGDEVDWKGLTTYVMEDVHQEFDKAFMLRLQLENPELQGNEYRKREFQQASVELIVEKYADEVADKVFAIQERIDEAGKDNLEWKALNLYLHPDTHTEFSKPFFYQIEMNNRDIMKMNVMQRTLQQAAIEVMLDHREDIGERVFDVHERLGEDDVN